MGTTLTTTDINAVAVLRILETIREYSAETRFYQASTSEMFGAISPPQSETTPFIREVLTVFQNF